MKTPLLTASAICHFSVKNTDGIDIGEIKALVININDGKVAYAVLSFGGFMGLGEKLFAIPLEQFTFDVANEEFILNVGKDRLENAPGFDKDNWPQYSDDEFTESVNRHYSPSSWIARTYS
jgi:sporulation protein YlmC with PRC-barrel domain